MPNPIAALIFSLVHGSSDVHTASQALGCQGNRKWTCIKSWTNQHATVAVLLTHLQNPPNAVVYWILLDEHVDSAAAAFERALVSGSGTAKLQNKVGSQAVLHLQSGAFQVRATCHMLPCCCLIVFSTASMDLFMLRAVHLRYLSLRADLQLLFWLFMCNMCKDVQGAFS